MTDLVGQEGSVVIRIPGPGKPGEVSVRHRGETHRFIAYSDSEVPIGTTVWITAVRGGRQVDVRAIES